MNQNWGCKMTRINNAHTIALVVLTAITVCVNTVSSIAQDISVGKVVNLADIAWGAPGGGSGFPVGVRTAQQGLDSETGGITYYALFPAGSKFEYHWHTYDEFVVVAQGPLTIKLGEEEFGLDTGSYIVIPGAVKHEWTVPDSGKDAIILVRRAGPADFHFVNPS